MNIWYCTSGLAFVANRYFFDPALPQIIGLSLNLFHRETQLKQPDLPMFMSVEGFISYLEINKKFPRSIKKAG
jgi:hypothetical protein